MSASPETSPRGRTYGELFTQATAQEAQVPQPRLNMAKTVSMLLPEQLGPPPQPPAQPAHRASLTRSISSGLPDNIGPPGAARPFPAGPRAAYSPPFRGRGGARGGRGPEGGRGRGPGHYRRLWAEVTKVGRGQKLGDGEGGPFADSSVEEMLGVIRSLAPDASAVAAISQGLYYLDSMGALYMVVWPLLVACRASGALAALLKELSKGGLGKRAMEIFDWLRSLEEGHELGCLCDVYTYTTMISQCGSHQQLRRALELVAEMRGRGIPCNVHTYSALMNVCIKANELDLALDVYKQLLAEGCMPNLVTYNTLIDVYGKTGAWEDAVRVLDALEHQGIEPEIRTYNTVIIACNMSGQAQEALKVYERMLNAGAQPTATTYTALISAYGKNGQLDKALHIFEDMVRRGCERNVITYSSLISACEKAGRWELALELFNEMHREGCKPNVVTYNSLIAACAQGAQWEKAAELFKQMQARGCKPDSVTYGGLILAYERGGEWRQALAAFEQMRGNSCRPDSVVYNTAVGLLWDTGVVWAQAKAVQVFQTACRQGHFRLNVHSSGDSGVVEFGVHAFTVGAVVVSLMRWLSELRERLIKEGPALLRHRVAMMVSRGKPSREAAYPAIKAAVAAFLQGCNSPFRLYNVPAGCRLEASSVEVAEWLQAPALEAMLWPYSKGDVLRGLDRQALLADDAAIEARCSEAFTAVKRFEEGHSMAAKSMSPEYLRSRGECVAVAMAHSSALGFKDEVLHDAVLLLDRTMVSGVAVPGDMLPLLVAACLMISARQGAQAELLPGPADLEATLGTGLAALTSMEESVRAVLGGDTSAISTLRCLKLYLERLGCDFQDGQQLARCAGQAFGLLYRGLLEPSLLDFRPSLTAAAMLTLCRQAAGAVPFWPPTLQTLTGYEDKADSEVAAAKEAIERLAAHCWGQVPLDGKYSMPSSA